ILSRRRFLAALPSAGALGLLGNADAFAQAAPPETTRLRLTKSPSICWAPMYISEQMLRSEGFTDISFVDLPAADVPGLHSAGEADISMNFVGPNIIRIDAGDPIVFVGGVHVGCFEVFGGERVKRITDLKGRSASISTFNGAEHVFL